MESEKLSEINCLIQKIVKNAGCNPNSISKKKLNSFEIIDICKEIVELAEDGYDKKN